jgi:hypothetical protein
MSFAIFTRADGTEHILAIGTTGLGRPNPLFSGLPFVETSPRVERATVWDAVGDAIDALSDMSGVVLARDQMLSFLERTELMETIIEFGEVETQIRENLADELSQELIGRAWPTFGDLRNGTETMEEFASALNVAAAQAGYTVEE